MISGEMNWDDSIDTRIRALAAEKIARVTVAFHTQVLEELNVSNPRPHTTPAPPGSPPRKRTGWLQRHVLYELDQEQLRGRVGVSVNALYGIWLDIGTRFMAARPWLLATARKYWQTLQSVVRT